jgi:hypothetical protein
MLKPLLLLIIACSLSITIMAQPYIDPLNIRYTRAFSNKTNNATPFSHLYIGPDLPFKMKEE